ncbi:MAG: hypothetical protein Q7S27_05750 [Nanoarchaeota archaeon]|nr:hypothetical protein [Nanoarchaeota archaeon]
MRYKEEKMGKIIILSLVIVFSILTIVGIFIFNAMQKASNPETIAKKDGQVINFLEDYPNAQLKIESRHGSYVAYDKKFREMCEISVKRYEEVSFTDGYFKATAWIDKEKREVACFYVINTCEENWNCEEWGSCSQEGTQTRICTDLNKCGKNENKPTISQNCTPVCIENWDCTDWTYCSNLDEKQTRICTTTDIDKSALSTSSCVVGEKIRSCRDLNSCGTTKNKPSEQQSCTKETRDCGSNIQSQETLEVVDGVFVGNQPNFDCFIKASENCLPSKFLNTITADFLGVLSTTTTYIELKGADYTDPYGRCIYYQRVESNSVELSHELKQQMLNGGATQEEIEQQQQISNKSAQETVGIASTCKFETDNLNSILNRWKQGIYKGGLSCSMINGEYVCEALGDFENAECETSS